MKPLIVQQSQNLSRRKVVGRNIRTIQKSARTMAAIGIKPNWISVASIGFAIVGGLGMVFSSQHWFWIIPALLGILLRALCNLWDGLVAIEGNKATANGAFFNEVPDRFSDCLLLIAAGLAWRFDMAGLAIGLTTALTSVLVAYVRAVGASLTGQEQFFGLMSKPNRMAVLVASVISCLFIGSSAFLFGLIIILAGCAITFATRSNLILQDLKA